MEGTNVEVIFLGILVGTTCATVAYIASGSIFFALLVYVLSGNLGILVRSLLVILTPAMSGSEMQVPFTRVHAAGANKRS
jgi:hypothetical protein